MWMSSNDILFISINFLFNSIKLCNDKNPIAIHHIRRMREKSFCKSQPSENPFRLFPYYHQFLIH